MRVEHQGLENPPAWVQLWWVTPCQVKGKIQESPASVRHPVSGDGGDDGDGDGDDDDDEKGQQDCPSVWSLATLWQ